MSFIEKAREKWDRDQGMKLAAALLLFLFLRKKRETLRSWFVQGGVLKG